MADARPSPGHRTSCGLECHMNRVWHFEPSHAQAHKPPSRPAGFRRPGWSAEEASGQKEWWFRCLEVSRRGPIRSTRRALFALGSASVGSLCSCAPSNLYSGENRGTVSAWHQCPHAVSVLRCEHHAVGRQVHQHQAARHHKHRVAQTKMAMSNFGCVCRPRSSCPRSIVRVAFVACQTAICAFPTQAVIS